MARTTATTRLSKLRNAEAQERHALRDLQAQAESAATAAEQARTRLVEAHAAGNSAAIRRAEKTHDQARITAEQVSIRAEAQALRAERAATEAQTFEQANAEAMLADLEPRAHAVVERLDRSANELLEANGEWAEVLSRVDALLAHIPNASGRHDAPSQHRFTAAAREIRDAFRQGGDTEPPLPHWRGRRAVMQSAGQEVEAA